MSTTIESLELEILSNSTSATNGINALRKSLNTLKTATQGGAGLDKVNDQLLTINKTLSPVSAKMKLFSNSLKSASANTKRFAKDNNVGTASLFKFGAAFLVIRKAFSVFKSLVSKSSDYIENVNLFTVAMGEYADEAKAYAETVGEVMGIDPGEWMRNQGVFQTLATGFGVAGDKAAIMSKNLTQLGYDISSFFNLDIGDAMEKLQSGLAGELEPLRRIGYDLSQAKLEAVALQLGIDKAVSSMTQGEKAMLRYYAIMTQVTTVQGDMARTLEQPANQMRIFKAQVEMLARSIGNIFIPILNKVLPYLIGFTKVLREVVAGFASLVGFKMPEMDYSGIDSVTSGAQDTSSALEDATESAKKLKSYMMGFDELNVINPNTNSESTGDDPLGALDIDLPEYDFLAGAVNSRVQEIVDKTKEWLGLTGDIDSWSKIFDTRLGSILRTVKNIGLGIAAWKIAKGTLDGVATIKALLASPAYTITISAIVAIVGLTIAIEGMGDAIKNGLGGFNFVEIFAGSLLTVGGAALLASKLAVWIDTAFADSKVALAIIKFGEKFGLKTVGGVGAGIGAAVMAIVAGIPMIFTGIYDACKDGLDWLNGVLIAAGTTLVGAGIGFLIGGPIGAGIGALIGLAVGVITDLVILIVQKWDEISAWFKGVGEWFYKHVIQPVAGFFKGLWEAVAGFFSNLWNDIVGIWNTVAKWFDEKVIQPIVNFFRPIVEWISQFFYGCWLIIQAVWVVASTWFNETVVQPVVGFFKGVWTSVSGFFKRLWEDIKAIWKTVSNWFNTTVTQPVVGFFKGVWTSVAGFFSSLWADIKAVWKTVSTWFSDTIIEPVKTAFDKACEAIGKFFSNLWLGIRQGVAKAMNGVIGGIETAINWVIDGINSLVGGFNTVVQWAADVLGKDWGGITLVQKVSFNRIAVPTYAQGGFPESGQAFIARENGIPEMVGTIGGRAAVANNEQIVESVASGVAEANNEQNALLREQNALLRAILEKDSGVYLDGRSLSNSVDKYKREQGRVLIVGGAL